MADYTLTMLDTVGIQHYIFNSNRLQENIGASELVYRATTLWAFAALREANLSHNIIRPDQADWDYAPGFQIENAAPQSAEVVYSGGGNVMIIFRAEEDAVRFTKILTLRLLKEAPGLTLVARHTKFNWDDSPQGKGDNLADKRVELLRELARHKQSRRPSVPFLGLGVTAVCQSTGLPAVMDTSVLRPQETSVRLVSRETAAKLKATEKANKRLDALLGKEAGRYQFPYDIDNLGRLKGEESYVAVVHADGNRMGMKLHDATKTADNTRAYIESFRSFSKRVNEASLAALKDVVRRVASETRNENIPAAENYLPFRPLVFGGDDATFLCNGQIGVSLAAAYLEAFERETVRHGFQDMYACAGVAIVKMHYPFARAYDLSEELIKSAKKLTSLLNTDASALDWHYATSGLGGDLKTIRDREYTGEDGPLTLRPILLRAGGDSKDGRYWRNGLENVIMAFKENPYWAKKRNKVIGLREPLRLGDEAVKTYRNNFELLPLPQLSTSYAAESGWQPETDKDGKSIRRCVYFDAVEIFDQYIPLPTQEVQP